MIDFNRLQDGDKVRRIGGDTTFLRNGDVVTVERLPSGSFTVKGSPMGLAMPANWEHVEEETEQPRFFSIDHVQIESDGPTTITITTDEIGFETLCKMQQRSQRRSEIDRLHEQMRELQRKIDKLEGED